MRAGQIWYDVLRSPDLGPEADFATFAGLTVEAADRLDAAEQVRTAWLTVEVEPAG